MYFSYHAAPKAVGRGNAGKIHVVLRHLNTYGSYIHTCQSLFRQRTQKISKMAWIFLNINKMIFFLMVLVNTCTCKGLVDTVLKLFSWCFQWLGMQVSVLTVRTVHLYRVQLQGPGVKNRRVYFVKFFHTFNSLFSSSA